MMETADRQQLSRKARRKNARAGGAWASPTFIAPPSDALRVQVNVSPTPEPGNFPPSAQTNGSRDVPQDPVLQSLSGLTGTGVIISTKTLQRFEGVVASTRGQGDTTGVTLNDVNEISAPGAPRKDQLFIASTNIDTWLPRPITSSATMDIPKISDNGPDSAKLPSQTHSPSSLKAPSPALNKPAAALPEFQDYVTSEKQGLTAIQKRQAFENEMEKRMHNLVEFRQRFKLNEPLSDDLDPILAKDKVEQGAIPEETSKDATSAQSQSIGAAAPANAARGTQVAAAKNSVATSQSTPVPASKTPTDPVAPPSSISVTESVASKTSLKKPVFGIQAIPPFKGNKSRAPTGPPPATNGAPWDSGSDGVAPLSVSPSAHPGTDGSLSPATTANHVDDLTPNGSSSNTATSATSATDPASASASPESKPRTALNPFFGPVSIKKGPPVNIKDDFNPFKQDKVPEVTIAPLWPYFGERYAYMSSPPYPPHWAQPCNYSMSPSPLPHSPLPFPPPPLPPPSATLAAAHGYVYPSRPYSYAGELMILNMPTPAPHEGQSQNAVTEKALALQKKEDDLKAREEALQAREMELRILMATQQKSAILFKLRLILLDVTTRTYKQLLRCVGVDAQIMLDIFQFILDTGDFPDRGQLIVAMRRLSAKAQIYPKRFILDEPIQLVKEHPVNSGRYADIYQAEFRGITTCLKVIRVHASDLAQHMAKIYAKEAILWGQLSHRNLLPFYGLCMFRDTQVAFVAPWAENGNLSDFLAKEPRANRVLLCSDTAAGVEYLHANDVVHGDLKALNILVDASGRACLSDFGLSGVTDQDIVRWATQSSAASKGGTARWQAPELHNPEVSDIRNTKASDVFAWASTCYEAFTGNPPYFEVSRETIVAFKIVRGDLPTRPAVEDPSWTEKGLTEDIWDLLVDCWKTNASDRPNMSMVITRLDREKSGVDPRPPGQWKSGAAMRFNADAEEQRPSLDDLDVILTRVMDQSTRPLDLSGDNDPTGA